MISVGSSFSLELIIVPSKILSETNLESERFRNFHGLHGARLDAHQSVRGKSKPERTWLATLMVPFLFYQPEYNLRRFETMYTDRLICLHDWMELQQRLERDSNTFIIFVSGFYQRYYSLFMTRLGYRASSR